MFWVFLSWLFQIWGVITTAFFFFPLKIAIAFVDLLAIYTILERFVPVLSYCGILIGISLNLWNCLKEYCHFNNITILSVHEHDVCFPCVCDILVLLYIVSFSLQTVTCFLLQLGFFQLLFSPNFMI